MSLDDCTSCGSSKTVPVLNVERQAGPTNNGNPYRARCMSCDSSFKPVGEDDWRSHRHPHVLPKEAIAPGGIIPLEEWDRAERYQEVVDRIENYRGGGDGEEEDVEGVDEGPEPEATNAFRCPNCGARVTGYPDECPECEAPYKWD